jgi:hypothetical protein
VTEEGLLVAPVAVAVDDDDAPRDQHDGKHGGRGAREGTRPGARHERREPEEGQVEKVLGREERTVRDRRVDRDHTRPGEIEERRE